MNKAIAKAAKGHSSKREVKDMLAAKDDYAAVLLSDVQDGSYVGKLSYRTIRHVGSNGKVRMLKSPSLYTRVLQVAWLLKVLPLYRKHDNYMGLNCKEGCGITANVPNRSTLHLLKHLMYDRRDLNYAVLIDQRQCYAHVSKSVFRRKMKRLTRDRELLDFSINIVFTPDGVFPIGTPSSPLAHHILMLDFDLMCHSIAPYVLRYADNVLLAVADKQEAQTAVWRVKNNWWYDLMIRSKRHDTHVIRLEDGIDFCGYRVSRNPNKGVCEHDKGYCAVRMSTAKRARKCKNNQSWASYYGIMKHADCYALIKKIEETMKLQQLSAKIRIDRKMDAPKIEVRELADNNTVFTIYDYEIRRDKDGKANWLKCLIGIEEPADGESKGRVIAREFHGGCQYLIEAMLAWEEAFGREKMLPIEEVQIENQCGYIFKGSTNQLKYINEDDYQQSESA